jgi:hypothetical protein
MRVTPRSVKDIARNAGVPDELIDRHIDALVSLVFAAAKRERKYCRNKIKRWVYSTDVIKPALTEILSPNLELEPHESYDLL